MSSNHYQWQSTRGPTKKVARLHELDALSTIQTQLAAITKRLRTTTVSAIQTCNSCGGGHENTSCEASNNFAFEQSEQANYINNYQNSNPYSNTYNSYWRNHPNLQWENNMKMNFQPPQQQNQCQQRDKKQSLEETVAQLATSTAQYQKNITTSMHAFEVQMGQLAT